MGRYNSERFVAHSRNGGFGKKKSDLTIIILSSRVGHCMKSLGATSMIKVDDGDSILQKQLQCLNHAYPAADIILTVGYKSDSIIKKYDKIISTYPQLRIVENQLYESTNEAEDLRLAINNTNAHNLLILSGNLIFDTENLKHFAHEDNTSFLIDESPSEHDSIGATVVDKKITILSYGVPIQWCNMSLLVGRDVAYIRQILNNRDKNKLYVFEILNYLLEVNTNIKAIPVFGKMRKIESIKDVK
jgi:NDP-sugar pyrophosphorylase family protein